MIGFKIANSNDFAILPNISYSIFESYVNTFPEVQAALSACKGKYVHVFNEQVSNQLKINCVSELSEGIQFHLEISKSDLIDLGYCLNIYKDINDRIEELVSDFQLNYMQQMKFSNLVKRIEPLQAICPKKYLKKLSVHLDVFLMTFYEIREVTDTRYSVELILENTTKSDLLLGNHVESKIYLLLPY